MALNLTYVRIEKPSAASIGEAMNDIRVWLDTKKIEPVEFKTHSLANGRVELELSFLTADEASLFERQFAARLEGIPVGSVALEG